MSGKRKYGGRRDGTRVKIPYDLNAIFPYIMKRRCDSVVFSSQDIEIGPVMEYIKQKRREGINFGFFQFFVAAIVQLLRERPALNRFMKGRRSYQRDDIDISFVVKKELNDTAPETNMNVRFGKDESFFDIAEALKNGIETSRSYEEEKADDKLISTFMKLPRIILMAVIKFVEMMDFFHGPPKVIEEVDPLRCSVFIANLASIGIEAPYHHLYEWGTCSVFIAMGKVHKVPVVLPDDTIAVRKVVTIKVTLDERVADGVYFARSLDLFKTYFRDPEKLIREMSGNKD